MKIFDRLTRKRLEWTLNKLLLGAGADADPTEVDLPVAGAPDPHTLGGASHSPDTLANLNTKVSDATVCSETEADNKIAAAVGYGRLTVKGFQLNPATGDIATPEKINDGDTSVQTNFDGLNEYAEVLLPSALHITQWRQYGSTDNGGDAAFKIQYMDLEGNWHDWVTGIATRTTADFSSWDSSGGDVIAIAIKIVVTTYVSTEFIKELEVKY